MKEIEYKFLVDKTKWEELEKPKSQEITQGFLHSSVEKTVRIRTKGDKAFLTIKGKTIGITRTEFEYEIPLVDAKHMLEQMIYKKIKKHRFEIWFENHKWEVDVFGGELKGLILAELEVKSEEENFTIPEWATTNVSKDPRFYNAVLIEKGIKGLVLD